MAEERVKIDGLEEVQRELGKQIKKITGDLTKGMLKAGMLVRREAQKKAPVVTGNLKNSAYVITSGGESAGKDARFKGKDAAEMSSQHASAIGQNAGGLSRILPEAAVGFTAWYAVYIHENINAGKTGTDIPGEKPKGRIRASNVGEWKFLENAYKENTDKILKILARSAEI